MDHMRVGGVLLSLVLVVSGGRWHPRGSSGSRHDWCIPDSAGVVLRPVAEAGARVKDQSVGAVHGVGDP